MRPRLVALCFAAGLLGIGDGGSAIFAVTQVLPAQQQGSPRQPEPSPQASAVPVSATGAISGVVTDGITGRPIEGALIQLVMSGTLTPGRARQRTDARGRFLFHRLPASDTYTVQVSRQGYFDTGFKAPPGVPGGSRIPLRDGEWFTKANLTMWKPAVITGRVLDERGEPLVGVTVRPITLVPVAGRVRLAAGPAVTTDDRGAYRLAQLRGGRYYVHVPSVQITLPDGTPALASGGIGAAPPEPLPLLQSDDAGRTDGLSLLLGSFPTPTPRNAATAYPMYYHPAARSIELAEAVSVNYGEHRANIDVTLAPTSTVTISGQVTGPADVIAKLPVRLMPAGAEDIGAGAEAALTLTDPLGQFTFLRVPSGSYVVIASSTQSEYTTGTSIGRNVLPSLPGFSAQSSSAGAVPGADGLRYSSRRSTQGSGAVGRVSITVESENVANVSVPLQAGVTVAGHFLFDGSETPPPDLRPPMVRLEPADGNLGLGMPFSTPSFRPDTPLPTPVPFEIHGVLPGRYIFGGALGAATIESIDLGGQDLLTTPLVVTGEREIRNVIVRVVSKPMTLTGRVTTTSGAVPAEAAVIVFPVDRTAWRDYGVTAARFRSAQVTASGSFLPPPGLPSGEYYAVAVRQDERYKWTDGEFLNAVVGRATRFRLAPGMPVTLDLKFDGGGK
jgi:hypothetical protein